jgi:hypothetical protein
VSAAEAERPAPEVDDGDDDDGDGIDDDALLSAGGSTYGGR